jgi:LPXTG-motif cell wall-anchored protein
VLFAKSKEQQARLKELQEPAKEADEEQPVGLWGISAIWWVVGGAIVLLGGAAWFFASRKADAPPDEDELPPPAESRGSKKELEGAN